MKVTEVQLFSDKSKRIKLSFKDPLRKNPYNVKTIIGLDADEIINQFYGTSGDAERYYRLLQMTRQLVVRIELNPRFGDDQSYSSLRDDVYRMISSSRTGLTTMRFMNDGEAVAQIAGFIQKVEVPHFSKTPELQITIRCEDGMLKGVRRATVNVDGLNPDVSWIEDVESTAPHGMRFSMRVNSTLGRFQMHDGEYWNWSFQINPGTSGPFKPGDLIRLSSEPDNKYVNMVRGGKTISLADGIMPNSHWPVMFPGSTAFSFESAGALEWVSIDYFPTFWGV